MGEIETLEKDVLMSQRIENILRNVEGQVLVYLGHYRGLSENLDGQERLQDLEKIHNCIPALEGATEIITHEIRDFESLKNSIIKNTGNGSDYKTMKSQLNILQAHMSSTLPPLNAYIEGLKAIITNSTNAVQTKKIVMQRIEDVERVYMKFINENEAYIQGLQLLMKEIHSKYAQYVEK